MPALAHHDTITGPLTVADLDEARRDNPGSIWHSPHRLLPHGCDQQSRYATRQCPDTMPVAPMAAEACTDIGAEDDPYDGTAVFRGVFSALCITALLCAVVVVFA